ncbi:alginate export family protein [Candidatus Binatia bacterium]|nr:alginate export family protein [Candidatus Binatia bacterium]
MVRRTMCAVLLMSAMTSHAAAQAQPSAVTNYAPVAPETTLKVKPILFEGPMASTIGVEVSDQFRGEFVDWFATPADSPIKNFRYNFLGNRFKLGLRVKRDPFEVFVQYQHSLLDNLPEGGPGPGGAYFANTRHTFQESSILRAAWARLKVPEFADGRLSVQGGRQTYSDGAEAVPKDPTLQWLVQNRIGQRLIGPFEYTMVGRSFDGGILAYQGDQVNVTGFGFKPTQGGYEINANPEIPGITVGGLAFTMRDTELVQGTTGRFFWIQYEDHRDIVFLDNQPLPVREAEKGKGASIATIGANVEHVHDVGPGRLDLLGWGVGQFGSWLSQDQRAWAYAIEAGYQLPDVWAKPWMRIGIDSGSGDTNPNDDVHGTFFQLLPTSRQYAQFPFYNLMNNQDVFAQWLLLPSSQVNVRADLHWLRVNASEDLSYSGSGATKEDFFGYAGVPAKGRNNLAYLTDVAVTYTPIAPLTFYAYYGHAFGQGVINANFNGTQANFGYVEAILKF